MWYYEKDREVGSEEGMNESDFFKFRKIKTYARERTKILLCSFVIRTACVSINIVILLAEKKVYISYVHKCKRVYSCVLVCISVRTYAYNNKSNFKYRPSYVDMRTITN